MAMMHVMAIDIPDREPSRIRAGDTVTWRKSLSSYPASQGWVLYYRLINSTAKQDITAAADGDAHRVSVAKATSASYAAGDYTLLSWVANGTERVTLPSLSLTVLPDLAAVSVAGYDARSAARKMLDAIDAALASLSTGERLAVVEAAVRDRRLKYDFTGLIKLRNLYLAQVRGEEAAERTEAGLGVRNKINVRL